MDFSIAPILQAWLDKAVLGHLPRYIPGVGLRTERFGFEWKDELDFWRLFDSKEEREALRDLLKKDVEGFAEKQRSEGYAVHGVGAYLGRHYTGHYMAGVTVQLVPLVEIHDIDGNLEVLRREP